MIYDVSALMAEVKAKNPGEPEFHQAVQEDRKSTRLNSSHSQISYAVFCLKKKKKIKICSDTAHSERFYKQPRFIQPCASFALLPTPSDDCIPINLSHLATISTQIILLLGY